LTFAFFASAAAQDIAAAERGVSSAFVADDECLVGSGASGSANCALSALQLRARKEQEEQQQGEQAGQATPAMNASLLEAFPFSARCFSYTGGSCVANECHGYRGATCQSGKCLCSGCAGADGVCYQHNNKLIAKGVALRNLKYSSYKMYFQRLSTFGQMKTTMASSWMNLGQDKFDIYELPGLDDGHKKYFLSSKKWIRYVVGMKATTGTAVSPFAAYAVNLENKGSLLDAWGPSNIMLRICETPSGAVEVGAKMADSATIWAYVHHGSWYVYGSLTSPGEGGGWVVDPPLPKGTFAPCK